VTQEQIDQVKAEWQAACRADEVLSTLPAPESEGLVREAVERSLGTGGSPDVVLRSLAAGLAAGDWHASGEVLQLQVGLLMEVIAEIEGADHRRAAHVHTILSAAAAGVAVEAWRERAEQDELTGLRNRAGWEKDASRATGRGAQIAYASIDLDGLKVVNDGPGGHAAGDELLRNFARRLEIMVRGAGGSVYRYGGDEFSAMLATTAGDLDSVLEALLRTDGVAAFSHGVAVWPVEDPDLHTVVTKADERMYERKRERKKSAVATAGSH
jgi:diguanylate cyclase (GGDEF)-like protein